VFVNRKYKIITNLLRIYKKCPVLSLRKFFNVTFKIRKFLPRDLFLFTKQLAQDKGLSLSPDTIDIISKEYATNPRRIIQLLNNLITEFKFLEKKYGKDFVNNYESLITKMLIIREEWSDLYKNIVDQPHLFFEYEEINNINDQQKIFFKKTIAINRDANIAVIEKLLSNIYIGSKIPEKIVEHLNSLKYESIIDHLEGISIDEIILYILENLKTEIQRGTYAYGVLNNFKHLIELNFLKPFSKDQLNKIYNHLNDEKIIIKIIENLSEDDLEKYYILVNNFDLKGVSFYKELSLKKYKEVWEKQRDNVEGISRIWSSGLKEFINNIEDKQTIEFLQNVFVNYYHFYSEFPLYKENWIREEKLPLIIGSSFKEYLIKRVKNEGFDSESFQELKYLAELDLISIKDIEQLFSNSDEFFKNQYEGQEQEVKEKIIENIIKFIKHFNSLFVKVKKEKYDSGLIKNFIQEIEKSHSIQYKLPPSRNLTFNFDLLNAISSSKQSQKELLNFYLNIYRATHGNSNIVMHITKLMEKYSHLKQDFYKELKKLKENDNIPLKNFAEFLLKQTQIDETLFELYFEILKDKSLPIDLIKNKLKSLFAIIIKDDKDERVIIENFIEKISTYLHIKEIINSIIQELTFDDIKKLPLELQRLSYDIICENDNVFEFEEEIDLLKDILNTQEKYKDCILKVIVSKLQKTSQDELSIAIDLLQLLKNPSENQKQKVLPHLKDAASKVESEELRKNIQQLIKRFSQ